MPVPHKYGLRPSPRGFFGAYRLPKGYDVAGAPDVDLRPLMAAAGIRHKDQGNTNACVFYSGTVAAEYLSRREHPERPAPVFSPFYSYYKVRRRYLARHEIRSLAEDSGATGADFIAEAKASGLCPETVWPSTVEHFAETPSGAADKAAEQHQTLAARAIPYGSTTTMRGALHVEKLPIQIGMAVPPELESDEVAETGILDEIADPTLKNILGYHEVLVVASETIDGHRYFWIWNSWGEDWGRGGNVRIPATLLAKLTIEARVMLKIE